jgi:hypothetical protein
VTASISRLKDIILVLVSPDSSRTDKNALSHSLPQASPSEKPQQLRDTLPLFFEALEAVDG